MSDWQVGDLALCVNDGPVQRYNGVQETDAKWVARLHRGRVYTVTHISQGLFSKRIGLFDVNHRAGGVSTRFIKVTPPEADEFDRETIRLLNGKPVREDA